MTLGLILVLLGTLLIYAGIKGLSVTSLLFGKHEPSKQPGTGPRG